MLAIGSDHAGFALKSRILAELRARGREARDFGCFSPASVNYLDIARAACASVASGECALGILVCGTGIGMSMAANKVRGIRAALCGDTYSARITRAHNDANVLCLGERVLGQELALDIVEAFLSGAFEGGRHAQRVQAMMAMELSKDMNT